VTFDISSRSQAPAWERRGLRGPLRLRSGQGRLAVSPKQSFGDRGLPSRSLGARGAETIPQRQGQLLTFDIPVSTMPAEAEQNVPVRLQAPNVKCQELTLFLLFLAVLVIRRPGGEEWTVDPGAIVRRRKGRAMTVEELEDKVWSMDGIRIVIRDSSRTQVQKYTHRNAAQSTWRITQFLDNRIAPLLNGQEIVVVMGDGEQPHGRTLLRSIRESYADR